MFGIPIIKEYTTHASCYNCPLHKDLYCKKYTELKIYATGNECTNFYYKCINI